MYLIFCSSLRIGNETQLGGGQHTAVPAFNLNILSMKGQTERFGIKGFGVVSPLASYFEGHLGPAFALTDNMMLTLGAGFEYADNPARIAASIAFSYGPLDVFGLIEYGFMGIDSTLHIVKIGYTDGKMVSIGLMSQRWAGEGIYAAVSIKNVDVYWSVLYNTEAAVKTESYSNQFVALIGIGYTFKK